MDNVSRERPSQSDFRVKLTMHISREIAFQKEEIACSAGIDTDMFRSSKKPVWLVYSKQG